MRILIISTLKNFVWGGSEELWFQTALYALEQGHIVSLLVFKKKASHQKIELLKKNGCAVHYIGERKLVSPSLLKRYFFKFIRRSYTLKFSNRFQEIANISTDLVLLSQAGVLDITYYDDLFTSLQNAEVPYAVINQHHFESGKLDDKRTNSILNLFLGAKEVLFVSNRNREVLERQIMKKLSNFKLVRNPLNLSVTTFVPWPISSIPRFAVVARLDVDFKGQDILLQTLSNAKWRNREFCIEFYGEGPDREYIIQLIDFYGLANKAIVMGHANDVKQVWEQNQVLILASHSEGTPLSLVEAMLCGRPCIVTDVGDCGELINDNVTGWLAYSSSVKSLDEAMERAWGQQHKWEAMGKKASDTILQYIDHHPGKTVLEYLT